MLQSESQLVCSLERECALAALYDTSAFFFLKVSNNTFLRVEFVIDSQIPGEGLDAGKDADQFAS